MWHAFTLMHRAAAEIPARIFSQSPSRAPSSVRSEIFVEFPHQKISSPVGAASGGASVPASRSLRRTIIYQKRLVRTLAPPIYIALTELEFIFGFLTTKMSPRWGFHASGGDRNFSPNCSQSPLAPAGGLDFGDVVFSHVHHRGEDAFGFRAAKLDALVALRHE